ncbi:MAG: hypothetical protein ACFCU5_10260 [Pleurocapsa sp.]
MLEPIYQKYAPNIVYETLENYQENLDVIAREAMNSGYFKNLLSQSLIIEVTYTIDDYLMLLSTLSPYIALATQKRNSLFNNLKERLEDNFTSRLQLSHLSMWHIAQKL